MSETVVITRRFPDDINKNISRNLYGNEVELIDYLGWGLVIWLILSSIVDVILYLYLDTNIVILIVIFFSGLIIIGIIYIICQLIDNHNKRKLYNELKNDFSDENYNDLNDKINNKIYDSKCDSCMINLMPCDDVIELQKCVKQHIICTQCYNIWYKNAQKYYEHITLNDLKNKPCPVCNKITLNINANNHDRNIESESNDHSTIDDNDIENRKSETMSISSKQTDDT